MKSLLIILNLLAALLVFPAMDYMHRFYLSDAIMMYVGLDRAQVIDQEQLKKSFPKEASNAGREIPKRFISENYGWMVGYPCIFGFLANALLIGLFMRSKRRQNKPRQATARNHPARAITLSAVPARRRSAKKAMRILISGGPGSGCTSTAFAVGSALDLPVFDSDSFFHKPTDPPFQQQYSLGERRDLLKSALTAKETWILSGSIATWGLSDFTSTHGVFLEIPRGERLKRLEQRQRTQFGSRIDPGGDMAEEHRSFLEWAAGYEGRAGAGRNLATDQAFLESKCDRFMTITEVTPFQELIARVIEFLNEPPTAEQGGGGNRLSRCLTFDVL